MCLMLTVVSLIVCEADVFNLPPAEMNLSLDSFKWCMTELEWIIVPALKSNPTL